MIHPHREQVKFARIREEQVRKLKLLKKKIEEGERKEQMKWAKMRREQVRKLKLLKKIEERR